MLFQVNLWTDNFATKLAGKKLIFCMNFRFDLILAMLTPNLHIKDYLLYEEYTDSRRGQKLNLKNSPP